jgi:hypothetical protein
MSTLARKAVLVLGRFRHERKAVLEAILEELRQRGYLPISLDLESSRDFPVKETLSILIGMSRFVIADLSGSGDYRFELDAIGQSAFGPPVQPLLANSEFDTELLTNVLNYPQFLNPYAYSNEEELLDSLSVKVVDPPEDKLRSLPKRRATDGG